MKKIPCYCLFMLVLLFQQITKANFITANSGNYTTYLSSLVAGDTLFLTAGNYTNNLALNGRNGTAVMPIVIMGAPNWTTIFQAQSCCNTVSITMCSYVVIENLQLDGQNVPVDAVKGEGSSGNWAHHITLENLNIINYGNNQQIVGISTKCHAWNWIIRRNRIIGAGTGMYLGNSNGDKPFVNGIIENNFISNTLGYNIEIKHQSDTVRDNFSGTSVNGKTIIRHNVFCKELNGSTGSNARPNLLVGGFPLTGWGASDYYEIYGNFFWQNPTEALFQGTGNIDLYENIFVNHTDPSGYRAVYLRDQNGVQPQDVKIFHNTVWTVNSSGGIRIFNPNSSYQQYCYANVVFAPSPITNFTNSVDNITDTYANAAAYVLSATTNLNTLDLYPQSGQLTGALTPNSLFQSQTWWDKDFNGDLYNWTYRGAYSGCCINNGWQLQLDTMPTPAGTLTSLLPNEAALSISVFPVPFTDKLNVVTNEGGELNILNANGQIARTFLLTPGTNEIDLAELSPGLYFAAVLSKKNQFIVKIIRQ